MSGREIPTPVAGIVRMAGRCGGRAGISGTRLTVDWVLSRVMAGESLSEIADNYETPIQGLEDAVRFAIYAVGVDDEANKPPLTHKNAAPAEAGAGATSKPLDE